MLRFNYPYDEIINLVKVNTTNLNFGSIFVLAFEDAGNQLS